MATSYGLTNGQYSTVQYSAVHSSLPVHSCWSGQQPLRWWWWAWRGGVHWPAPAVAAAAARGQPAVAAATAKLLPGCTCMPPSAKTNHQS